MDYLAYLQTFWEYFPYLFYSFVFLTFLPKSLRKIRAFATADYEANRHKYHRCYAPDVCCHTLGTAMPKPKPRKAVTRVYPKKHAPIEASVAAPQDSNIKRQVQPDSIQTSTHVTQIAKMFESGHTPTVTVAPVLVNKKINRVTPTILCQDTETTALAVRQHSARLSQLLQQNIESAANHALQVEDDLESVGDWCNEPMAPQRRTRAVPSTLNYTTAGTSTTPSTASPAASSPLSSSPHSSSPLASPVLRRAPLNMKSSLEDIFAAIARNAETNENFNYAGCKMLSPVTSIDDILDQRRLSRPLSAYSISDLLNEENASVDETQVEQFLRVLNKT